MKPAGHPKRRRTLEEVLASTSEVLFPTLLGHKRVTVNSRDVEGDSPLHVMARRQDRYAVQLLLESGAHVNAVGDMAETPLHVAVSGGDLRIVALLLHAGANAYVSCAFGDTSRERAVRLGGAMAKLFEQYPPKAGADVQSA